MYIWKKANVNNLSPNVCSKEEEDALSLMLFEYLFEEMFVRSHLWYLPNFWRIWRVWRKFQTIEAWCTFHHTFKPLMQKPEEDDCFIVHEGFCCIFEECFPMLVVRLKIRWCSTYIWRMLVDVVDFMKDLNLSLMLVVYLKMCDAIWVLKHV